MNAEDDKFVDEFLETYNALHFDSPRDLVNSVVDLPILKRVQEQVNGCDLKDASASRYLCFLSRVYLSVGGDEINMELVDMGDRLRSIATGNGFVPALFDLARVFWSIDRLAESVPIIRRAIHCCDGKTFLAAQRSVAGMLAWLYAPDQRISDHVERALRQVLPLDEHGAAYWLAKVDDWSHEPTNDAQVWIRNEQEAFAKSFLK